MSHYLLIKIDFNSVPVSKLYILIIYFFSSSNLIIIFPSLLETFYNSIFMGDIISRDELIIFSSFGFINLLPLCIIVKTRNDVPTKIRIPINITKNFRPLIIYHLYSLLFNFYIFKLFLWIILLK